MKFHIVALALIVIGGSGCASSRGDLPPTFQASGTVVQQGNRPVTAGGVQLTPVGDPTYTVFGDIRDDGSFELATIKGDARVPGAPAGEYHVVVLLPSDASAKGGQNGARTVRLPKTYRIEPRENALPIDIGSGRK